MNGVGSAGWSIDWPSGLIDQDELDRVLLHWGRVTDDDGDAHSAANLLRERGVRTVAVTMGKGGAFLLDDAGGVHILAVDRTGLGMPLPLLWPFPWQKG